VREIALLDPVDERLDDRDVDVGFEQRDADLARDLVDVLVAEAAAAAERTSSRLAPHFLQNFAPDVAGWLQALQTTDANGLARVAPQPEHIVAPVTS